MPKFDVEKERSPKTVAKAEAEYAGGLDDIRYDAIAMFIAQGETASKAYRRAFPDASQETASAQASVLTAHPTMKDKIRDQQITARNLITAALPRSVRKTVSLLEAESEQVQLKAASSIQDRAGLPAQAELSVHATVQGASLYQSLDSDVLDVIPLDDPKPTSIEGTQQALVAPDALPGGPQPATPSLEALEDAKGSWKALEP